MTVAFLALAVLVIFTAFSGLYLDHRLNASFQTAVQDNQVWSRRLARYSSLSLQSSLIAKAGNEALTERGEKLTRFANAMGRFDELADGARADLTSGRTGVTELLLLGILERMSIIQTEMNDETGRLFAALRFAQPSKVVVQAVAMNRRFNALRDVLEELRGAVLRIQEQNLREQQVRAAELQSYEQLIAGLAVLMVLGVALYGLRISVALRRAALERTAHLLALEARSSDMRLVLDHVDQGLLTVDREGRVSAERSAAFDHWFGACPADKPLWEHIGRFDVSTAAMLRLSWEALIEDQLPLALALDQMPRRISAGQRTFSLCYLPIRDRGEGGVDKVLVIISDITTQLEREQAEAEQRDMMNAVERLVSNRDTFAEFIAECGRVAKRLLEPDGRSAQEDRRLIHTLKGNSSLFGLSGIAMLCHEIEGRGDSGGPSVRDMEVLAARWERFADRFRPLLGESRHKSIEISETEYAHLLSELSAGAAPQQLARMIRLWTQQPTRGRLEHLAVQVRELARRLGRGPVQVLIETTDLRLSNERWSGFWAAFVHLVRNVVDHGIEPPEERREAGKPDVALVNLRTYLHQGRFVIEISDDGHGIDWKRLAARAAQSGLPCATEEDLIEALFHDGISTKEEATELSGRGVGMGAVLQEVRRRGGVVEVASRPSKGTTFRFLFPVEEMVGDVALVVRGGDGAQVRTQGAARADEALWGRLRPLVSESCEGLFADWGLSADWLGETEEAGVVEGGLAALLRFTGTQLDGWVGICASLGVLRRVHPQAQTGAAVPLGDLQDLVGELVNQLAGRLKLRLAALDIGYRLGMPEPVTAVSLSANVAPHRVVCYAPACELYVHLQADLRGSLPEEAHVVPATQQMHEGDMVLF